MKTSPPFWQNLSYKTFLGTAFGLCLSLYSHAQEPTKPVDTPLATPTVTEYPGILQTFEALIQVDNTKFKNIQEHLIKNGKVLSDSKKVSDLELEPDFLNSIILHSDAGYIRLASTSKCSFYDTIMTDLLRSAEGKLKNVMVTYVTKTGSRESALLSKKEFLGNVVTQECPESVALIAQFQVKTLEQTLNSTLFEVPNNRDQCRITHLSWLNNPKTPYLCQIHEFLKEAKAGGGEAKDLMQRQTMAKIIDGKLNLIQKDYIENVCTNLDHEEMFCNEFLNVSFWSKIAGGQADKIYADSICQKAMGSGSISGPQLKQCLARLKKENDLCMYGAGRDQSLSPHLDCDSLSLALNHSSLRSNYRDCPGSSDQLAATNFTRVLLNITQAEIKPVAGPCSAVSIGETVMFNDRFDNDEGWTMEACFFDKIKEREICSKTFFGNYGDHPIAYTNIVAGILRETRGADKSVTCKMIASDEYNPLLLQYKTGCQIIYDRDKCFASQCKHRILYNDSDIDFIKIKNRVNIEYFPLTIKGERFTLQYLLTRDFKQVAKSYNNLTSVTRHFRTGKKGILYGIGCAEDLLPTFFKVHSMNQCSPIPFIVDGMIQDEDSLAFVTRTAADSLQAPRILSWSNIYSGVRAYQRYHPLKLWTLYALD